MGKKDILLLGEYSTGKTALINMLLGAKVIPERLTSTNMPVIRISSGEKTAYYYRKEDTKKFIRDLGEIPQEWGSIDYAGVEIKDHPLLAKKLVIWDTPGINSTNNHHNTHLQYFINNIAGSFRLILFILPDKLSNTSLDFLKKNKEFLKNTIICINIKDAKSSDEIRLIEREVKKTINLSVGSFQVNVLNIGTLYEAFTHDSNSDFALTEDFNWRQRNENMFDLISQNIDNISGDDIFEHIHEIANEELEIIENYKILDNKEILRLALEEDDNSILELGLRYYDQNNYSEALKWFEKSAKLSNNSESQYYAGLIQTAKDNGLINAEKGIDYLEKAALKKHVGALGTLGKIYYAGEIVKQDFKKAIFYFEQAAKQNDYLSSMYLGLCYWDGNGTERDIEKAKLHLTKGTQSNFAEAYNNLGLFLEIEEQDYDSAKKCYESSVSLGDAEGNYFLGLLYYLESDNESDQKKGVELFREAASLGVLNAKYYLAHSLCFGIGSPVNPVMTVKILNEIIQENSNHADANYLLAQCYYNGMGIKKDFNIAFELFTKVATIGNEKAKIDIGICYLKGTGTNKNPSLAFNIFLEAAKNGFSQAQELVGYCYFSGEGTPINYEEAKFWNIESARNGSLMGLVNLGVMFENGNYVSKNILVAGYIYNLVSKNDYDSAESFITTLLDNTNSLYMQKGYNDFKKAINLEKKLDYKNAERLHFEAFNAGFLMSYIALERLFMAQGISIPPYVNSLEAQFIEKCIPVPVKELLNYILGGTDYFNDSSHMTKVTNLAVESCRQSFEGQREISIIDEVFQKIEMDLREWLKLHKEKILDSYYGREYDLVDELILSGTSGVEDFKKNKYLSMSDKSLLASSKFIKEITGYYALKYSNLKTIVLNQLNDWKESQVGELFDFIIQDINNSLFSEKFIKEIKKTISDHLEYDRGTVLGMIESMGMNGSSDISTVINVTDLRNSIRAIFVKYTSVNYNLVKATDTHELAQFPAKYRNHIDNTINVLMEKYIPMADQKFIFLPNYQTSIGCLGVMLIPAILLISSGNGGVKGFGITLLITCIIIIGSLLFSYSEKKEEAREEGTKYVSHYYEGIEKNILNSLSQITNNITNYITKVAKSFGKSDIDIYKEADSTSKSIVEKVYREVNKNQSKDSSCFIVTATFGSPDIKIVRDYRSYRDTVMLKNYLGRKIIDIYYKIGPFFALKINKYPKSRKILIPVLKMIIKIINLQHKRS